MQNCEVFKSMREMCNETCDDWEECPLASMLREGKKFAEQKTKMEKTRLRDLWPAAVGFIGVCTLSFNLTLGLGLILVSSFYMFREIFRTPKKETEVSE